MIIPGELVLFPSLVDQGAISAWKASTTCTQRQRDAGEVGEVGDERLLDGEGKPKRKRNERHKARSAKAKGEREVTRISACRVVHGYGTNELSHPERPAGRC